MKKPNRRSKTKFPALQPRFNLKTRHEELSDFDYIDKLNEKEKAWLNSFLEEEVNANFKHSGKILNKSKASKRACYNKNNARNRDIYSKAKASGRFVFMSSLTENSEKVEYEDQLIFEIDRKKL